jgi:hypothetical protein
MRRALSTLVPVLKDSIIIFVIYTILGIILTFVSLIYTSSSVKIGTLRPILAIPTHEIYLLIGALLICLVSCAVYRRFDFSFLFLPIIFTIMLDLDHLPVILGVAQPIRPAHSIFFLLALILILRFVLKKPLYIEFLAISSFLMHIAIDNGVFALFSPFSFEYYDLGQIRIYLGLLAIMVAVMAGYSKRVLNFQSHMAKEKISQR